MKGWVLEKPNTIVEKEIVDSNLQFNSAKVKINMSLLTLSDALRFMGEEGSNNVALGSYGIGVISEADANLLDLEKGKHVYVDNIRCCTECYNCLKGEEEKCSNLQIAGSDYNGFLSDFRTEQTERIYALPESVDDFSALFIGYISNAIAVVDKLNVQKGDYVAIIGANNFGNILAQLLAYYQAVPIVCTQDEENYKMAKDSGIYYVLGKDDNWQKEVSSITGGRMASNVVYISDCEIPAVRAFNLASFNANVAFTGLSTKSNAISFTQAIKKQLVIHCVNNGYSNTAASINLLANKAIDLSFLKLKKGSYKDIENIFKSIAENLQKGEKFYEFVIDNN